MKRTKKQLESQYLEVMAVTRRLQDIPRYARTKDQQLRLDLYQQQLQQIITEGCLRFVTWDYGC